MQDDRHDQGISDRNWWIVLAIAFALGMVVLAKAPRPTRAEMPHSGADHWYPIECCHRMDCAPVDRTTTIGGELVVTSEHGTATVPQTVLQQGRVSKDARDHVCIRGGKVVCYFTRPSI